MDAVTTASVALASASVEGDADHWEVAADALEEACRHGEAEQARALGKAARQSKRGVVVDVNHWWTV